MNLTTCGMCNQPKSYGSGCGCSAPRKQCKTPVASIVVNGQVTNQETVEFLGSCLGTNIEQDGCGHKLQISIPCVAYNEATSILTIETPDGVQEIDLSSLGDMDVYVNQGMFDGSNILLTDTEGNTIAIDITGIASSYTANADGSFTLESGNGIDSITIPAECCTVSVELNGLNLETTDSLGNTIVTDLSSLVSEITANGDGTWTHSAGGTDTVIDTNHTVVLTGTDLIVTNADGDTQTIDLSAFISTLTANPDGTFTHSANGTDVVLPAVCCNTGVVLDASGTLIISQSSGPDISVDLSTLAATSVEGINQSATLAGTTLTITDDDGDVSVDLSPLLAGIAACCNDTMVLGADNVLTITQTGGNPVTVDFTSILNADNIAYDNTASGSPANNVQSAIDDIYSKLGGATSVLTDNGDGSFTHDDGNGNTVTIPAPAAGAVSSMTANADGSITHDDGNGNTFVIPAPAAGDISTMTVNADGSVTHVAGGVTTTIPAPATSALSAIANADGSTNVFHNDGTGNVTSFCVGALLEDEDGRTASLDCTSQVLGRTLHVQSPDHTTGLIDVSFADADQATVSGVSTTHTVAAVAATNATNTGVNSIVSGNANNNSGAQAFLAGRTHTNTGESSILTGAINNNSASFSIMGGRQSFNTAESSLVHGSNNRNEGVFSYIGGSLNENYFASNIIGGTENIGNGDLGFITGQNNNINTGGEYKGITYGKNNIVSGALSIVGGNQNVVTAGLTGVFGDFNVVDGLAHVVGGGNHILDGNRNAVFGNQNISTGDDSIVGGALNDDAGFVGGVVFGLGVTAIRDFQTHTLRLALMDQNRRFPDVATGMANTLQGEVFYVGAVGAAQELYRHG